MIRVMRAVLSGSFSRDRQGLLDAYDELITCGCQVLSPHRLDFDDDRNFIRDKAEKDISAAEVERHHLLGIAQADFLWIHTGDGSIGFSTAVEIGYAIAHKIPIYMTTSLREPGFASFIRTVPSVYNAMKITASQYS